MLSEDLLCTLWVRHRPSGMGTPATLSNFITLLIASPTISSLSASDLLFFFFLYISAHSGPNPLLQNRPLFQAICPGSLWAWDNRWLLSWVQRLAGPEGEGTGAFCSGWRHQTGQKCGLLSRLVAPTGTKGPRSLLSRLDPPTGIKGPPFVPVGVSNRDKTPWPPYPLPSPPARAIQLTCSCCSWLGREEFLLISSPHL